MLFILGTVLVILISIKMASFLSVIFLVGYFQLKRRIQNMTGEKWQAYFEKIGPRGIFVRILICYSVALCMLAYCNMFLFWQNSLIYGLTFLVAGTFHIIYKYYTKKEEFHKLMNTRFF